MSSCNVADRIRFIRTEKGMTQTELAAKCNVTKSLICKIEAKRASIHLELLLDIAQALEVTVTELLEEVPKKSVCILREKERKKFVANYLNGKTGFDYYRLAGSKEARIEIFVMLIGTEALKAARFVSHEGVEFNYVLCGSLRLQFKDQEHILGVGDSAFYDSSKDHRLVPHECDVVQLICTIVYPQMHV
jgi:Predicted transcriptional regulators